MEISETLKLPLIVHHNYSNVGSSGENNPNDHSEIVFQDPYLSHQLALFGKSRLKKMLETSMDTRLQRTIDQYQKLLLSTQNPDHLRSCIKLITHAIRIWNGEYRGKIKIFGLGEQKVEISYEK